MKIKMALFAAARELVGSHVIELDLDHDNSITVQELRDQLSLRYPELNTLLPQSSIAVDHEFAVPQQVILPESDVALIPPVSGG